MCFKTSKKLYEANLKKAVIEEEDWDVLGTNEEVEKQEITRFNEAMAKCEVKMKRRQC